MILTENQKYEYGCVMIYINTKPTKVAQKYIEREDIYEEESDRTFGLEKTPHITCLYGLHNDVTPKQVKEILDQYKISYFIGNNISCFNNPKYDVLKWDIKGDVLFDINKELTKLPYTSDFPNYHPHSTIAYLQPGKGDKYVKLFKGIEVKFKPLYGVYSEANGNKTKIKLNII